VSLATTVAQLPGDFTTYTMSQMSTLYADRTTFYLSSCHQKLFFAFKIILDCISWSTLRFKLILVLFFKSGSQMVKSKFDKLRRLFVKVLPVVRYVFIKMWVTKTLKHALYFLRNR